MHGLADGDVEWFKGGWFDDSWWFSFENICFVLGLDVGTMRKGCVKIVEEGRGKEVKAEFTKWCKEMIDGRVVGGVDDGSV